MKTTIYLIRHSKPLKEKQWYITTESLQSQNEKDILSVEGEKLALDYFKNNEFSDINNVYCSNYIRAISTAKYVASNNNLDIKIMDKLGERKFGVSSWNELPKNFGLEQFNDNNYKINDGESQQEVAKRMDETIKLILSENIGKRSVVICHATAMMFLFKLLFDVKEDLIYKFNDSIFFKGKMDYLETFKLEFENKSLIKITNIKF